MANRWQPDWPMEDLASDQAFADLYGGSVQSTTITTIVTLSQVDYDALSPPDASTLYLITS